MPLEPALAFEELLTEQAAEIVAEFEGFPHSGEQTPSTQPAGSFSVHRVSSRPLQSLCHDGSTVYVCDGVNILSSIDMCATWQTIEGPSNPQLVNMLPGGNLLVCCSLGVVWIVSSNLEASSLLSTNGITSVIVINELVLVATVDGAIHVLLSLVPVFSLSLPITCVSSFSPMMENKVYAGMTDGSVVPISLDFVTGVVTCEATLVSKHYSAVSGFLVDSNGGMCSAGLDGRVLALESDGKSITVSDPILCCVDTCLFTASAVCCISRDRNGYLVATTVASGVSPATAVHSLGDTLVAATASGRVIMVKM